VSHQTIPYEEVLRAAGHRVTEQRVFILDAVCEGRGHTTLGEIYARARHSDPSLDRSTVYRTLKLFVALGLVVSADTGTGDLYYEIAKPRPHHHLVCRQCGSEQEIDHDTFTGLFASLFETYHFRAETDHIVLFGICARCQNSAEA
jgi:Fur family ferric uptake transcriptional regulator